MNRAERQRIINTETREQALDKVSKYPDAFTFRFIRTKPEVKE